MKKFLIAAFVVLLVLISTSVIYTYPRQLALSIEGVEYQLGAGQHHANPVRIQIDGQLRRGLTGRRTFRGIISIEGTSVPNSDNRRQLKIEFGTNGQGLIQYAYFKNGTPIIYTYGSIFANNNFSNITIQEFRINKNDEGWNAANGLMISGPANNRSQALNISNELMKSWLQGYTLR